MKEIKISPPEGFEIDKENSTFELIKFKQLEKKFPESWDNLGVVNGFCVTDETEICIFL